MELIKSLVIAATMLIIANATCAATKNTYAILPDGAKIVAGTHKNEFYILGKDEKLPGQDVKPHQSKLNIKKLGDKKVIAKLNETLRSKKISKYFRELTNKKVMSQLHNALKHRDKKAINANIQKLMDKKHIEKLRNAIEHEIASQQHTSKKKIA